MPITRRVFAVLVCCLGMLRAAGAAEWDPGVRWTAWALMEEDFDQAASELFQDILAKDGRFAFDRLNRARCLLDLAKDEEAVDLLQQAAAIDAGYPHLPFLMGLVQRRRGELAPARESFQKALSMDPGLVEAQFQLGLVEENENRLEEARAAYEKMLAMLDTAGRLSAAALTRARFLAHKHLSLVHSFAGRDDESTRHYDLALAAGGDSPAQDTDLDSGPGLAPLHPGSAVIARELTRESIAPPPATPAIFPGLVRAPLPLSGTGDVTAVTRVTPTTAGPDLWAVATSLGTALIEAGGAAPHATFPEERVAAAADLTGDGTRELVLVRTDGRLQVVSLAGIGGVAASPPATAPMSLTLDGIQGSGPVVASDLDHDGDLDLLVAGVRDGKAGLHFHRNQAPPGPGISPVLVAAADCGATTGTASVAISLFAADLDDDSATDVVALIPGEAPCAWLGQRQCRFLRTSFPGPVVSGPGALADLDGDGQLDLVHATASGIVVVFRAESAGSSSVAATPATTGSGRLAPGLEFRVVPVPVTGGTPRSVQAADLGGSPRPELVADLGEGRFVVLENRSEPGALRFEPVSIAPETRTPAAGPSMGDFDHDGDIDLLLAGGEMSRNETPPEACRLELSLRGTAGKVPFHGVGSRVFVRAGPHLVRVDVDEPTEPISLGAAAGADLVRIAWTDGTIQNVLAPVEAGASKRTVVACGTPLTLAQKAGLGGSCPYLYVDEGGRWKFVTDVLAGSPLGLPSPAGGYIPTVPTEHVTLPASTSPAADGSLRVRVTEEYREVTYLDEVTLVTLDHPAGWTVVPAAAGDEPLIAFSEIMPPLRAIASAGGASGDLTRALASNDGVTFVPPRTAVQGLAPEHTLELSFAPSDDPPWLILEGLVYWTDAGINTALAQTADPGLCAPPALEVPDGRGGWKRVIFPLPFPAGRQKAVAIDVSAHVDRRDPRLRLVTTMRFFWDRIGLGRRPATDPVMKVTRDSLSPASARVVDSGFARLGPDPGEPPWSLDTADPLGDLEAAWIAPVGSYTRHGAVTDILDQFDDHYLVLGPGDGAEVVFRPPPVPVGSVRTWALRLSGYCKDAHPATFASGTVEPWPYRAMPTYAPQTAWPAGTQQRLRELHAPTTTRPRSGLD